MCIALDPEDEADEVIISTSEELKEAFSLASSMNQPLKIIVPANSRLKQTLTTSYKKNASLPTEGKEKAKVKGRGRKESIEAFYERLAICFMTSAEVTYHFTTLI